MILEKKLYLMRNTSYGALDRAREVFKLVPVDDIAALARSGVAFYEITEVKPVDVKVVIEPKPES